MLNFIRKLSKFFQNGQSVFTLSHTSNAWEFSCSKSLFILGIFCLFNFSHSGGWEWYIMVILIYISLIIVNDVKPVFLCLLAIYHFRKCTVFLLFLKKICLLIFYYQDCIFLIFILIRKLLPDIVATNIFSEFEVCIFILWMVSFEEYQSFIWWNPIHNFSTVNAFVSWEILAFCLYFSFGCF